MGVRKSAAWPLAIPMIVVPATSAAANDFFMMSPSAG
jgi:hypothetical protein